MSVRADLVNALEAGDQFFGEGLAGLGPEQTAGDAAVFLDQKGEGEQLFDILLDVLGGVCVQFLIFEHPRGIETKIDAYMAVLLVAAFVKLRPEA